MSTGGGGSVERSLWLEEALGQGFQPTPSLKGQIRADVCVVGGGYTGLWTALALRDLEPTARIVILEADFCGAGASGRNGGLVLSWWSKFHALRKLCGTDEAIRLAVASAEAVSAIGRVCEGYGIDAGYRSGGWLWAATNSAQMGSWRSTVESLEALGLRPFREMGPQESAAWTGSAVHRGGVLEATAAVVHPAALAIGLRRAAIDRAIQIFERSPMIGLQTGPATQVRTPGGNVRAGTVVLALNAWGVRLRPLRRVLLVLGSDMVVTEPIPHRLAQMGWRDGLGISDSRLLVHYYRTTQEGRVAFGKGGGLLAFGGAVGMRFDGESQRRRQVEGAFRAVYPMLADVRIERSWTGPIDRTRSGLPFFGPLDRRHNVLVGAGYSGNGVGPAYLGGRILASLVVRRDDGWSGCGLVGLPGLTFPPEPFRFLGGVAVRKAIERKERAEDESRRPGPLARHLVRFAPAGLVPTRGR